VGGLLLRGGKEGDGGYFGGDRGKGMDENGDWRGRKFPPPLEVNVSRINTGINCFILS